MGEPSLDHRLPPCAGLAIIVDGPGSRFSPSGRREILRGVIHGALVLVAGGGILYRVFQDIAPSVRVRRHWAPALRTTLGFIVGRVGEKLPG
jgi:hypothetical protein